MNIQKISLRNKTVISLVLLIIMFSGLIGYMSSQQARNTMVEPLDMEIIDEEIGEVRIEEEPDIEVEPEVFTVVEEMPEFPGGQEELFKFIGQNIQYPPKARELGIEGTVYVGFVVSKDGAIEQVQIKRGLGEGGAGCDEEALRVVNKMPKWIPGKQRGKPVRVAFTLPIRFKLQ